MNKAIANCFLILVASALIQVPRLATAQEVELVSDEKGLRWPELELSSAKREGARANVVLDFTVAGSPGRWMSWRTSPRVTVLLKNGGATLARGESTNRYSDINSWTEPNRALWCSLSQSINSELCDTISVIEVNGELAVASDVREIEIRDLTGAPNRIELAAGKSLLVRVRGGRDGSVGEMTLDGVSKDDPGNVPVAVEFVDSTGAVCSRFSAGFDNFFFVPTKTTEEVAVKARLLVAQSIEIVPVRLHREAVPLRGYSDEALRTLTLQKLRADLSEGRLDEEVMQTVAAYAIIHDKEELAEALIEAGADVAKSFLSISDSSKKSRGLFTDNQYRLMRRCLQRELNLAVTKGNSRNLQIALGAALEFGTKKQVLEILSLHPPLMHARTPPSYLQLMLAKHELYPDIADEYANAVLNQAPTRDIATQGGFDEMSAAAYMGDNERLQRLVQTQIDIQGRVARANNALMWACFSKRSNAETVGLLMRLKWIDKESSIMRGMRAAIGSRRVDLIQELRGHGPLPKGRVELAQAAAETGSLDVYRAVVNAGVIVNSDNAAAVLGAACTSGNPSMVSIAIETLQASSLSENEKLRARTGALSTLATYGHAAGAKQLLELGVDFLGDQYVSILGTAAGEESDEVFDLVLAAASTELGTEIPAKKITVGEDAIIAACRRGRLDRVQKLVKCGAKLTERSTWLGNAVSAAVSSGNAELVTFVLDAGLSPEAKDDRGLAPVRWGVARFSNPEILRILASRGADVKAVYEKSSDGLLTVMAMNSRNWGVLTVLGELGAPFAVESADKLMDALAEAIALQDAEKVERVLEAGAKPGILTEWSKVHLKANTHLELAQDCTKNGLESSAAILRMVEEAGK